MRDDDMCRCPNEHRILLLGTCWRCLGRATTTASSPVPAAEAAPTAA